ncbi:hypothetical protein O6H91_13G082200 [Diphasiastrum complanatum]|uniref:Uncharacterized protein n=1 Tax=Diphasiastrum complanatum TaxID=34168 RepID=A0ACC2BX17_DIPCM|nr:hypothetical protein O6H91_13G082200 [Diphasiastrum complanatum]
MDFVVEVEAISRPLNINLFCNKKSETSSYDRKIAEIRLVARHPEVYEPCEDSYAIVDALLADRAQLLELQPKLCVEVGSGSGYVITSLALLLNGLDSVHFLATDINQTAAETTSRTLNNHAVKADVVVADLLSGLENRCRGCVDVLLFNPPYVPTPEDEVGVKGITCSWAGGLRGRSVIDRMLRIVNTLMSEKGLFYLVTVSENQPVEICHLMKRAGFASCIAIQRSTEEEVLQVLKFWRQDDEV